MENGKRRGLGMEPCRIPVFNAWTKEDEPATDSGEGQFLEIA